LGHPLFFSNKLLPYLENIREETAGLRQVVQEFYSVIQKVEFDTPDVLADLNTPESYKTFLEKQNKN
jgi:molybdenum cofactor cytidylyltransferase